jgi:hypothetical protein
VLGYAQQTVLRGFVILAVSSCLERPTAAKFLEVYGGNVHECRERVDKMCSG